MSRPHAGKPQIPQQFLYGPSVSMSHESILIDIAAPDGAKSARSLPSNRFRLRNKRLHRAAIPGAPQGSWAPPDEEHCPQAPAKADRTPAARPVAPVPAQQAGNPSPCPKGQREISTRPALSMMRHRWRMFGHSMTCVCPTRSDCLLMVLYVFLLPCNVPQPAADHRQSKGFRQTSTPPRTEESSALVDSCGSPPPAPPARQNARPDAALPRKTAGRLSAQPDQHQSSTPMELTTLTGLHINELQDLYSAEPQLATALPHSQGRWQRRSEGRL